MSRVAKVIRSATTDASCGSLRMAGIRFLLFSLIAGSGTFEHRSDIGLYVVCDNEPFFRPSSESAKRSSTSSSDGQTKTDVFLNDILKFKGGIYSRGCY